MYGRVRIYNLGFVIYTAASLLLAVDWLTGRAGAIYLIGFRIVQGIGGACLLANAAAIITDAFPANQRGMALGINNIVGVSGMFIGLVLGGLLAPIDWRLVFLISVPVGPLRDRVGLPEARGASAPKRARVDWAGNVTLRPRADPDDGLDHLRHPPVRASTTGWGSPRVLALLGAGVACLVALRGDRAPRRGPDVPPAAVPHPGLHLRHALHLPLGDRARRADVHADHLAAGHLAAPARLRLHRHAAVGGHLHAAADVRDADRGADLRLPLRPLRRAPVRDRRDGRRGARASGC